MNLFIDNTRVTSQKKIINKQKKNILNDQNDNKLYTTDDNLTEINLESQENLSHTNNNKDQENVDEKQINTSLYWPYLYLLNKLDIT